MQRDDFKLDKGNNMRINQIHNYELSKLLLLDIGKHVHVLLIYVYMKI